MAQLARLPVLDGVRLMTSGASLRDLSHETLLPLARNHSRASLA